MKCDHKDCFTCPYPDCIAKDDSEVIYREKKKPGRKKIDPELRKQHEKIAQHEYYLKHKERIKATQLEYYKNHCKEICDKQKSKRSAEPITTKTIWITNNEENKRIKAYELPNYINKGWKRGKTIK